MKLAKIREAGFTLDLVGEDLEIAPFQKLTPNQLAFLKSHKAEIVQELRLEKAANQIRDEFDDRRHCHECRNLVNSRCMAATNRYRPVDTHPRRCKDFMEVSHD